LLQQLRIVALKTIGIFGLKVGEGVNMENIESQGVNIPYPKISAGIQISVLKFDLTVIYRNFFLAFDGRGRLSKLTSVRFGRGLIISLKTPLLITQAKWSTFSKKNWLEDIRTHLVSRRWD
jgi:hypothetical protein